MPDNIYGDLVNPNIVGTPTAEEQLEAKRQLELQAERAQLEEQEQQPQAAQPAASPTPSTEVNAEQPTQELESTDPTAKDAEVKKDILGRPILHNEERIAEIQRGISAKGFAEKYAAIPTGGLDFGVDFLNFFLPENRKFAKLTEFESQSAQAVRQISSVVLPTLLTQGLGTALGQAANARVGWAIGKSRAMQWFGNRGIEAASGAAVGAITTTNEEGDNLLGMAKKSLPAQWDFIPDSMATLDTDSPDMKKQKSINEDLSLGLALPIVSALVGNLGSIGDVVSSTQKVNLKAPLKPKTFEPVIVPETPAAKAWTEVNAPEDAITAQARRIWNDSYQGGEVGRSWNELDEASKASTVQRFIDDGLVTTDPNLMRLAKQEIDQLDQLDELGYYNNMMNPENTDVALRGVHDLFDWNETAMRSVDNYGVVGASIDAARIAKNAGTVNGRLGNMLSLAAMKYSNATVGATENIVTGLARQLKQADRFSVSGNAWKLSADEIDSAGQALIKGMFDPTIDAKQLQSIIEPVQIKIGDQVATFDNGYSSMFKDTEGLSNVDLAKTQAYLQTSVAGQISDLSEAVRINGESASKQFALEKLNDRLMFMFKQDGLNTYYANAKSNVVQALKNKQPQVAKNLAEAMEVSVDPQLARIQAEAEEFSNTIKWFEENEPEMLDAFMEMYELTDGRIKNINDINRSIRDSFTNFNVFWKKDPDGAKNMLLGALRANHQNSMLSGAETGSSALIGNLTGVISQPASYFAGAISRGAFQDIQRGWMAYSAVWDTTKKSLPYAAQMFRRASANPKAMLSQTKLDLVIKNEELLESYKKIADVQAQKGNHGLKHLIEQYEMWHSLAQDPVFRFVPNTFTGFDGFARSVIANGEARFRAMNAIEASGGKITRAEVKRLADIEYNSMFNSSGLIEDEAVKYATDEIALNLDLGIVKGLDKGFNRMPFLRSIIMFPTSVANMAKQADDVAIFSLFQKDINQLAYTPVKDFVADPDLVNDLLSQRGYKVNNMTDAEKLNTITDLKNRVRGKKAIAAFITTSVTGAIMNDALTGDGLYDKQAQASRVKNSNWKARTIKIGDKRVEYEDIVGPGMANWIATYANIIDNFDMLGEAGVENLRSKMMFILGAAFTDKNVLNALGPLTEMLQGNNFAVDRWAAGHINALSPMAGFRGTASKVLDGGLREVNYDLLSLIQNRNAGLFYDEANRMPYTYNAVTGKVPNKYGLMGRLWNAVSPIKVHPDQTAEEKFLQQIEWDQSTTFKTRAGVELLPDERSAGLRIMGEMGYFRGEIKRIMNSTAGKKAIVELEEARDKGISSDMADLKFWRGIHIELGQAQRDAERLAFERLDGPMRLAIEQRKLEDDRAKTANEFGIIDRK